MHHSGTNALLSAPSALSAFVPAPRPAPEAGSGGGILDLLPASAGAAAEQCVYVTLHLAGRAVLRRPHAELPVVPGDLVISGGRYPANLLRGADCASRMYRVPCKVLGISAAEVRAAGTLLAPGSTGIGAMASQFLAALGEHSDRLAPLARIRLARSSADLLALLITDLLDQDDPGRAGGSAELLARIRAHIEQNLGDPELSPESVAGALCISVRYLHRLFQQDGTTVGQWIRHRRLEACRRDLDRPANRRVPVAVVAGRWGFISASHFSRVFREVYGLTPSQWQGRADTRPA
ncbi:helix-turn-helix domain-containing protein [Kitasatospora sp. NPDC048407]|uniref:helix-turn-helix domain-containing protein n=1 Tax=Kitasatospora sp. NPDC048407 TaxID=3364051 RepID=UPI0037202178